MSRHGDEYEGDDLRPEDYEFLLEFHRDASRYLQEYSSHLKASKLKEASAALHEIVALAKDARENYLAEAIYMDESQQRRQSVSLPKSESFTNAASHYLKVCESEARNENMEEAAMAVLEILERAEEELEKLAK